MFINFVIDADNTDDIIKAIELLSYHLNNQSLEPKKENWEEENKQLMEETWKKKNSDLAQPKDG